MFKLLHNRSVTRRTLSAVGIAVVVGLGAGSTAVNAAAGPAVANLGTTVFKISGKTFGASATIPAGTALQKVSLTTDDPDAGPQGVLGLNNDPSTLVTGEAVTVKVNGATIATVFPGARATSLATDAGTFTVLVFSAGGNSYAIPRRGQEISAVTATTASSKLNAGAVSSIVTLDYGFLPVGAPARNGQAAVVNGEGATAATRAAVTVYDVDDVRANSDSVGDEVGVRIWLRNGEEVLATVQFADGSFGVVRGVRYVVTGSYGLYTASYLFESAALTSAGKTINDVQSVLSAAAATHGLTWSALGLQV